MEWKEDLSNLDTECPPKEAQNQDIWVYRIIDNLPSKNEDFYSYRHLYPSKKFKVSECQARACSVFKSIEETKSMLKLLGKDCIIKIHIKETDGVLLDTPSFRSKTHMSWWISKSFDVCKAEYVEVQ